MNINVDYEKYCEVISEYTESYYILDVNWSCYSGRIVNELGTRKSVTQAFEGYCVQFYNICILLEKYKELLSANFYAIDNAVNEYLYYDQNTANNINSGS